MNVKHDRLYEKRVLLAKLMNNALDASYGQDSDPDEIAWYLNRRRDQRFSPDSRDIRSLPESQLDYCIDYYTPHPGRGLIVG